MGWSAFLVRGRWPGTSPGEVLPRRSVLDQAGLDVGSSFDAVIAGRPLRLHVVGEINAVDFEAALDWSTLTAADPPAAGPPRSCDRSEAACFRFQRVESQACWQTADPTTEKG
jgi:hypothetical protein